MGFDAAVTVYAGERQPTRSPCSPCSVSAPGAARQLRLRAEGGDAGAALDALVACVSRVRGVGVAAPAITANAWVHDFREGSRDMRRLLGGKGANVAEMTRILGPDLVPAGFTITTEACVAYMDAGRAFPPGCPSSWPRR